MLAAKSTLRLTVRRRRGPVESVRYLLVPEAGEFRCCMVRSGPSGPTGLYYTFGIAGQKKTIGYSSLGIFLISFFGERSEQAYAAVSKWRNVRRRLASLTALGPWLHYGLQLGAAESAATAHLQS